MQSATTATSMIAKGVADGYSPFLNDHLETMPRDELERMQEAKLANILGYAYERAPLIRQIWDAARLTPRDVKSLHDFKAKAPFMHKDMILAFRDAHDDPCGGMNSAIPGELKAVGSTSGTTGDPMPVAWRFRSSSEQGYARDVWHMGARPGDHVCNLIHTLRNGLRQRVIHEVGFIPIAFSISAHEMPRLCEASKRYRPTALWNLANPLLIALEQLFEKTGEDPVDVFSSYKGAIFGGEPLGPRLRGLTQAWGLEIFETTTLGDICGATECSMHDGMHAWEDQALVECLDPQTDEPVPDGQPGELVVTALSDPLMPLIRFRTDDIVSVNRSRCGCGRTHLRFKPLGRKGDQIIVKGRSILPRDVWAIVESHSESRAGLFQIIRPSREMDELAVRVGFDPDRIVDSIDKAAGRIRDQLAAETGIPVRIELTPNGELLKLGPPHKKFPG